MLFSIRFYDKMTGKEKKIFMNSFLKSVEIYKEERCDGRFLKNLCLRFPVFCEYGEIVGIGWDNKNQVEICCMMCRK